MRLLPGSPARLGAHWDGLGTDFALWSRHATGVELCLFDAPGQATPTATIALPAGTGHVWHGRVEGVGPGQLYGYRVHGPFDPVAGHRFNPAKLLQDPWARAIRGGLRWDDALFGSVPGDDARPDPRDSAPFVPRSVVVDDAFPWDGDAPPATPLEHSLIYECHVKGTTRLHPEVPAAQRGRYRGLASAPVIRHLERLGVTAVELLPVQHGVSERALVARGLTNYWGYNTLGFFAPDARFATGDGGEAVREFKTMVKALHRAGIEVILDVVYNHTPEGDLRGPTLCLRGVDHASYYQLDPADPARPVDATGCGNTLVVCEPPGLWLLMDSLRYWVDEMHVDGFRFDLAPALARRAGRLENLRGVFDGIRQDPVLAGTKLFVEPWDLGEGGFRLGGFPEGFSEWNAHYRDGVRRFWRGDRGRLGDLASRLAGSEDILGAHSGPLAGVSYVTCHDGFTLADLVSYADKHNQANGEDGLDGSDANWSANWGVEGPSADEAIQQRRDAVARALLATLAFSQGVPMISHGDELLRSQGGNNNAYCHDDETTWLPWDLDDRRRGFLDFARRAFALRARHPALRRTRFFDGAGPADPAVPPAAVDSALPVLVGRADVHWLRPDGAEMSEADWKGPKRPGVLGMLLPAEGAVGRAAGEAGPPETLLLAVNAGRHAVRFALPAAPDGAAWHRLLASAAPDPAGEEPPVRDGAIRLPPHALVLLALRPAR